MDYEAQVRSSDLDQLRLLAIFHYVLAGLSVLCSCFPMLYIGMGAVMMNEIAQQDPDAGVVGVAFVGFGFALLVLAWIYAGLLILTGRSLQTQRRWTYCVVVAGLSCLNLPFGTILGVFTLVVLMRPSVKDLFVMDYSAGVPR